MQRVSKVSVSLPESVLQAAERARREMRESRSEFFRRAVEDRLRHLREQAEIERYVAGYVAEPETTCDLETITAAAAAALADQPWSDEELSTSRTDPGSDESS